MASETEYWFRPKKYGYGAEPINAKGWIATAIYVALVFAVTLVLIVLPALNEGREAVSPDFAFWITTLVVLTGPFLWLCWKKTDGEWRWRWGVRD